MATAGSQNAIFFPPSHFFFFFPHWPVARKTGEELWEDENRGKDREGKQRRTAGGRQTSMLLTAVNNGSGPVTYPWGFPAQ